MLYDKIIKGKYTIIRSVVEDDARFILKLRTDEVFSKYINKTDTSLEKQIKWIKNQINTENDFYFLSLNNDGKEIGLASIYNITDNKAEFGRWISIGNQIQNLEMVLLLHDLAFFEFNLNEIYYVVVKENVKVSSFWKRFGAKLEKEYNNGIFDIEQYHLKKENYTRIREIQLKLLQRFY